MIYRAMQYHVGSTTNDFGNDMSVYADGKNVTNIEAQKAFTFLYTSGALTGTKNEAGERYVNAQQNLTRGQMAKILNTALKYLGH